jgi:hypothetical protein
MNIRASYFQETEAMVEHLTKRSRASGLIMYQDDALVRRGLAGVKKALDKRQMQLCQRRAPSSGDTLAVKAALLAIRVGPISSCRHDQPHKPAAGVHQSGQTDPVRRHLWQISRLSVPTRLQRNSVQRAPAL